MSAILDLITGGGLLPHVYCKKVTIETHPEDSDYSRILAPLQVWKNLPAPGLCHPIPPAWIDIVPTLDNPVVNTPAPSPFQSRQQLP